MARKKGLDVESILTVAVDIVDRQGWQALSLATLAARLEIKSPSLYAHFEGLEGVRVAVALWGARAMRDQLADSARRGEGVIAFRSVAHAYRRFSKTHRGLYTAVQRGAALETGGDLAQAQREIIDIILDVIGRMGTGGGEAIHMVRAIRSALHGFVVLEQEGGFGLADDVDSSFERLVDLLIDGISKDRTARWVRQLPEI